MAATAFRSQEGKGEEGNMPATCNFETSDSQTCIKEDAYRRQTDSCSNDAERVMMRNKSSRSVP